MTKSKLTRIATAMMAAAAFAPAALAEDAYIQSDGTQFINTGYYVTPATKIELDFAFVGFEDTSSYVQTRVFDNHPTAAFPNLACTLYVAGTVGQGNRTLAFALGDRETGESLTGIWASSECDNYGDAAKGQFCDNLRRTAVVDEANHYAALLDETGAYVWRKAKPTTAAMTSGGRTYTYTHTALRPLTLLGRPTNAAGSTSDYRTKARIYGFRIYENGNLAKNYIPAVKGGEAGLYDTIGKVFLASARPEGNLFASGGDIREIPDDGYIACTDRNDTLWIDTGYNATGLTRVELDFTQTETFSGYPASPYLFGTQGNCGTDFLSFAAYVEKGNNPPRWSITFKNKGTTSSVYTNVAAVAQAVGHRTTFVADAKNHSFSRIVGGLTNAVQSFPAISANATAKYPMALFRARNGSGGVVGTNAVMRVYGMKIFENDVLQSMFVPYVSNGVPGILDTHGDLGFRTVSDGVNPSRFTVGGRIGSDAVSRDACIETDGTQYIDLGYHAKSATRFELDCALVKPDDSTRDQYLFGTHGGYKAGNFPFSMYVKKASAGLGWNCQTNNSNYTTLTSTRITAERQKFVLDGYGNAVSVRKADGTTLYTETITCNHANAESPYGLAVCASRGKEGSATVPTPLKVFTARIYEANVLKHEFVPYMQDGVAGLYDTVTGAFKVPTNSGANALVMSGKGVNGAEMWVKAISATATEIGKDKTATLTAAAAGAKSYIWKCNDVVIPEATGETCTATWRKGHYETPDTYTCTPVYDVFGVTTYGNPVTNTITRLPDSFVITVR